MSRRSRLTGPHEDGGRDPPARRQARHGTQPWGPAVLRHHPPSPSDRPVGDPVDLHGPRIGSAGDEPCRHPSGYRRFRPGGSTVFGGRGRHDPPARGARLSARPVPVSPIEPANRRVRRLPGEPGPIPTGGPGGCPGTGRSGLPDRVPDIGRRVRRGRAGGGGIGPLRGDACRGRYRPDRCGRRHVRVDVEDIPGTGSTEGRVRGGGRQDPPGGGRPGAGERGAAHERPGVLQPWSWSGRDSST